MILRNESYCSLAKRIINEKKKIIVYGVGMIGQVVIPYLIERYDLMSHLDCFIDADKRKQGTKICIYGKEYYILAPEYLEHLNEDYILFITNSIFFSIIEFLDRIENLKNVEAYVIPMMQIEELKKTESVIIARKTDKPLIPKKIHYCWFGERELPVFLKNCIHSWEKFCPDYEIVRWNEENYNVNRHNYTKEAYKNQKYGFVSDYARLDILYENGGIYFDTDVTLEKNLDDFLYQEAFIGVEKWGNINTGGGCGFIQGHPMLKKMIEYRDSFHFELSDGSLNVETNGLYETIPFLVNGFKPCNELQEVAGVTIYPSYVNHPYDYMTCETNRMDATASIHHFYGGWMEQNEKINRAIAQSKYKEIQRRINTEL